MAGVAQPAKRLPPNLSETLSEPHSDFDYFPDLFIERDGKILGPDQSKTVLAQVMPEEIARFYLFDGELLQEYEELVWTEPDSGKDLAQAIERILGLPILTGSCEDLYQLQRQALQRETRAAQDDLHMAKLGAQLADDIKQRDYHYAELGRLETELHTRRADRVNLEEQVNRGRRQSGLMDQLCRAQAEIVSLQAERPTPRASPGSHGRCLARDPYAVRPRRVNSAKAQLGGFRGRRPPVPRSSASVPQSNAVRHYSARSREGDASLARLCMGSGQQILTEADVWLVCGYSLPRTTPQSWTCYNEPPAPHSREYRHVSWR